MRIHKFLHTICNVNKLEADIITANRDLCSSAHSNKCVQENDANCHNQQEPDLFADLSNAHDCCFSFDGSVFQVSDEIKEQAKKW